MLNREERVTYFAQTDARNKKVPFGIRAKDRTKHVYVIGKTGMGKSTLLENMAVQDIQNGEGMAFIDPHGKTAELLLNYVPENRIDDIVYFAPFDMEHPISFNVMEDVGPDKRHLVVNGLMSAFKKIWVDAWSARMEYILNNTLLALLEYPGSTLIGVNKMLADKEYRKKVVAAITDPAVKAFWVEEFAKYGEKYMQEAGAAIQNKIGQFISNPLVRNIIGQPKSSFDIRKMMDENKIIIINLSKGRVGEANANLLGSMLITKIYLAAMSRADVSDKVLKGLPNFYLFVDEFQSFANESFADILSEARKYKLNLTIAHQYIEQMSEEVRAAVFGNVGTMIMFRVGAFDAEVLEKEFIPEFTAEDMVNLGVYQIYLKLMIDGVTSRPFSATTLGPIKEQDISYRDIVIEHSRRKFAQPRAVVEEVVREQSKSESENIRRQPNIPPAPQAIPLREAQRPERSHPPAPVKHEKKLKEEIFKALSQEKTEDDGFVPLTKSAPPVKEHKPAEPPRPITPPKRELAPAKPVASAPPAKASEPKKDPKKPTVENINQLKEALAAVIKSETKKEEVKREEVKPAETPVEKVSQAEAPHSKRAAPEKKEQDNKEVSEDTIKKILEIDE